MVSAIQLTEQEVIGEFTLTHWKICNWKVEVARPELGKDGHVEVWVAKCFLNNGILEEPFVQGVQIILVNNDFDVFMNTPTTVQNIVKDFMDIVGQFLIDNGNISGTLVDC